MTLLDIRHLLGLVIMQPGEFEQVSYHLGQRIVDDVVHPAVDPSIFGQVSWTNYYVTILESSRFSLYRVSNHNEP